MRYDWMPPVTLDINICNPDYYNVFGVFYKYNKIYSDDNILITSPENLQEYLKILVKHENTVMGNLHWVIQHLDNNRIINLSEKISS